MRVREFLGPAFLAESETAIFLVILRCFRCCLCVLGVLFLFLMVLVTSVEVWRRFRCFLSDVGIFRRPFQ